LVRTRQVTMEYVAVLTADRGVIDCCWI